MKNYSFFFIYLYINTSIICFFNEKVCIFAKKLQKNNNKVEMSRKREHITTNSLIERLKNVHGDKYLYDNVEYVDCKTKITLTCPKHGDFSMLPFSALRGQGCPKCKGRGLSEGDIIERFRDIHGDKYDYSKVNFNKMHEKVCIICPQHGEFWMTPSKHYSKKQGCPKCGRDNIKKCLLLHQEDVINKFNEVHGGRYNYSNVEYRSMRDKVDIICPKHGVFRQYPFDHINGHGCPKCGMIISKNEDEIFEYICQFIGSDKVVRNERGILNGREIDILIPSKNIGIEYNGLRWYSENFGRNKYYHLNKLDECNNKGVKLIQIFEDEYINKKSIVLSKIKHILGLCENLPHIMGRKCEINTISKKESREFLDKNHIQGYGKCTISYGCFYNKKLIGVMSFTKDRNNNFELVRFATDNNYICSGVGGKLFKYFVKENNPNTVKTFADRRWTIDRCNNLYTKLGFYEDKVLLPDYRYVKIDAPYVREHKFNFRKSTLHKKYNLSLDMTEDEMTKKIGYSKIYDCGLIRYIWRKENGGI